MNKLEIGPRLALAFGTVLLVTAVIALVEEIAAASSLKGKSYELVQVVGVFRLDATDTQGQRLLA